MAENNGKPLCTLEAYEIIRQYATELNESRQLKFIEFYRHAEPVLVSVAENLATDIVNAYDSDLTSVFNRAKNDQLVPKEVQSLKDSFRDEVFTMLLFGYVLREKLEQIKFSQDFEGQFDFLKD